MTPNARMLAAALALAALALSGCDRREAAPKTPASSGSSAPQADAGNPPGTSRPSQTAAAPKPDSKTQQEPPVQGQADARQGEQKQHFDNKR